MPKEENAAGAERRDHKRYSVNIQVVITADIGKATGIIVGTSLEGLRIKTPNMIPPDTDVVITFLSDDKIVLLAGIVWVIDRIEGGLPSYVAGLKINSVSVHDKELKGMAERTAFLQDLVA